MAKRVKTAEVSLKMSVGCFDIAYPHDRGTIVTLRHPALEKPLELVLPADFGDEYRGEPWSIIAHAALDRYLRYVWCSDSPRARRFLQGFADEHEYGGDFLHAWRKDRVDGLTRQIEGLVRERGKLLDDLIPERRETMAKRVRFEELPPEQQLWLAKLDLYMVSGEGDIESWVDIVSGTGWIVGSALKKPVASELWEYSSYGYVAVGLLAQGAIGIRKNVPVEALKALGIEDASS